MKLVHRGRIERVRRALSRGDDTAALLVSSAPPAPRSRDTHYPYRQNSDFFYLTGSRSKGLALLVLPEGRPVLYTPPLDKTKVVWEGAGEDPKPIAAALNAELVTAQDFTSDVLRRLQGIVHLYHHNDPGSFSLSVARRLLEIPPFQRRDLPRTLSVADLLLERLRLFKDAEEISAIKKAGAVTAEVLFEILPHLRAGVLERDISAAIDAGFRKRGCEVAFGTIVGSGRSAATLHYEEGTRPLRQGELCLIDCGAEYELYAGDITRVLPVGGRFLPWQRQIYQIVLDAQTAAIRKIRHGVKAKVIYDAAALTLTRGLVRMKVLRGRAEKLFAEGAFRPYFPHGIGHTLGLDVHDVGNLRGNTDAVIEKGMVITVEPGLYFPKRIGAVPPCGVRIEDDVLVGQNGCTVLTPQFPKEMEELEALLEAIPK